jgi:CRP/FNR family cyclic AMP-dependent transcriptional regulator
MAVSPPRPFDLRAASLFDIDPELGELLDARQLAEARSRAIVPVIDLAAGAWSPAALQHASARPFGVMVVDGLVLRELLLAGSTATEMLGPCDIVGHSPADDALLPTEARWSVPDAARVAVLDDRLLAILRTWPGVGRILLDRAARRELRLATHRAIAQLPRVDQRLLAFFGHLAERWGRIAPHGVIIPLHLTHETLGRLIGARRPTVSLALKDLASSSLLERRNDASWLLRYEAFERLGAEAAIPSGWQAADARPVAEPVRAADVERPPARSPRLSPEDVKALRARVELLREQHTSRISRCATVLERSRAARRSAADEPAGRDAA